MLIDMYYDNVIEQINDSNKTTKGHKSNTEQLIIKPDLLIEKIEVKNMEYIYKIFFDNDYFKTYDKWNLMGYMSRHLNNTDECFKLYVKYSRMQEGYENVSEKDCSRSFYGNNSYNTNFDENGVLLKCSYLSPKIYSKYLSKLESFKNDDKIIDINKKFIYDNENNIEQKKYVSGNVIETKYINMFDEWFNDYKALCIKSPYGTGKTYAFRKILDKYKYKRVLFITYRQSLAHSFSTDLKEKYNFVNYLDEDIETLKKSNRVIIQLDSLKKLINYTEDDIISQINKNPYYDLVVLDESEGLLNHLSFDKIEQFYTYSILTNIIIKSNKILCLDGDLSDRTIEYITNLDFSYKIYRNKFIGIKKKFIFSYNISNFEESIQKDLEDNKKVVIVCMTKTESEKYNIMFSNYKVILHNSIEKNKDKLLDVNKYWSECDLLIYSPTVEAGIDFNITNHFHKCYATLSNQSTSYRAFFQMLNRVRYFEDNDILCLLPVNLDFKINNILCTFNEMKMNKWNNIEINNLTTILIYNDVERYNSRKNFMTCIIKTLKEKGHTYEYLNDKPSKRGKKNDDEGFEGEDGEFEGEGGNENFTDYMKNMIIKAKDINIDEYNELIKKQKSNEIISREENLQIQKFVYKMVLKIDTICSADMELNYNKLNVIKNYNLLNGEELELKETDYLKQFKNKKCENIKKLVNICGFSIDNKTITKNKDKILYKDIKQNIKNFINTKQFKQLFEIDRDINDKNILTVAEDVLDNYGYCFEKNKIKVKDENNKFVHNTDLKLKTNKQIDSYLINCSNKKIEDNINFIDDDGIIKYSKKDEIKDEIKDDFINRSKKSLIEYGYVFDFSKRI